MEDLYNKMISRQMEIFTNEEQELLRKTPVCIVGCGGLGGTVIEQLVRAGFENLTIIDQDVFDESNLNRQIRSNHDTIGKSKVESTINFVKKINPSINIKGYDITITPENMGEIFKDSEILIDAVDNVLTRVQISREARKQNMIFIHCAVETTQGQITVIKPDGISYEELFKLKTANKELTDELVDYLKSISLKKPHVLGITPSIFAALEVNETIKYILNKEDVLFAPKVLMWDLFDMDSFRIIEF